MRRSYHGTAFFVLAVMAAPQACGAGQTKVPWPELASCAAPVEQGLLNAVIEVLRSGPDSVDALGQRAEQALEDLAVQHGASTVACAVATATDLLRHKAARAGLSMSADPEVTERDRDAARRGLDFLAVHHIAVQQR